MAAVGARPSRKSLHPRNSAPRQTRSARGETRTALRPLAGGAIRRGHHATARVTVTVSHCESADATRCRRTSRRRATLTTSRSERKVKGRPSGGAAGTAHARFLASGPAPWPLAAWPTRPPPVETRWAGFAQRARGAEPGDSERFEEGDSALAVNSQCGRGWTPPSQKPPPLGSFSSASPRPRLALTTVTWRSGVLS